MSGTRGIHRRLEFDVTPSLVERFKKKVGEPHDRTGCCHWRGAMRNGYGAIKHNGRVLSAHVVSYRINVGPIPEGHVIRHSCDTRSCVNHEHLSTGLPAKTLMLRGGLGRL